MKVNSPIKLILFYQIISLICFLFVISVNSIFIFYDKNVNYFVFRLGSTNRYRDSGYDFIGSFARISRFDCTFTAKWEWNVALYDRRRFLVHKHVQLGITVWFDDWRFHDGSLWQTNHIGNTVDSTHCYLGCYGKRTISRCSVHESSVFGNFWRLWTTDMPGDNDLNDFFFLKKFLIFFCLKAFFWFRENQNLANISSNYFKYFLNKFLNNFTKFPPFLLKTDLPRRNCWCWFSWCHFELELCVVIGWISVNICSGRGVELAKCGHVRYRFTHCDVDWHVHNTWITDLVAAKQSHGEGVPKFPLVAWRCKHRSEWVEWKLGPNQSRKGNRTKCRTNDIISWFSAAIGFKANHHYLCFYSAV